MHNDTPIDVFLRRGEFPLTKHQGEILFAESAGAILDDAVGAGFADAPPDTSSYRPAEIEAIACWNCSHFQRTGIGEDNWPTGLCHLFEAKVQGEAVCDRFTADSTMRPYPTHTHEGEDDMDFSEVGSSNLVELFFSGEEGQEVELAEDTGLITKAIMRTGEWKKTPSSKGVIKKPLKVVRDGVSSMKDRIISLQEIVDNFEAGAYPNVPIPLTDEENKDHKNLLRLNTGWVKKLWIKDEEGKPSKLMAGLHFTEPDARGKVQRGTYPDVSSGIFFNVERPTGEKFNSALNHVVITHKPFMDGLGGFQFSDGDETVDEIESVVLADEGEDNAPDWNPDLTDEAKKAKVLFAAEELLDLPERPEGEERNTYVVKDLMQDRALIFSEAADQSWIAQFSIEDDGEARLVPVEDWQPYNVEASQEEEQPSEPAVAPEKVVPQNETPLERARRRRGLRSRQNNSEGGVRQMAKVKVRDISEVDFSDAEDAKAYAVELSDANKELGKTSTEGELSKRIDELKELGFAEMPGFLAEYRDIYLSDDGEAAMVLLSHDDDGNEIGKKALTGVELADRLIAAIPTDKEGKVLLSGQALDTGQHEAPPAVEEDAEEDTPEKIEERTKGVAATIGLDLGGNAGKEE